MKLAINTKQMPTETISARGFISEMSACPSKTDILGTVPRIYMYILVQLYTSANTSGIGFIKPQASHFHKPSMGAIEASHVLMQTSEGT